MYYSVETANLLHSLCIQDGATLPHPCAFSLLHNAGYLVFEFPSILLCLPRISP